jgi:hypothetical protein
MDTTAAPPDACNEAEALRALNWPVSRREHLRERLPSIPSGTGRLYQKTAVEALCAKPDEIDKRNPDAIFTR